MCSNEWKWCTLSAVKGCCDIRVQLLKQQTDDSDDDARVAYWYAYASQFKFYIETTNSTNRQEMEALLSSSMTLEGEKKYSKSYVCIGVRITT